MELTPEDSAIVDHLRWMRRIVIWHESEPLQKSASKDFQLMREAEQIKFDARKAVRRIQRKGAA